MDAISVDANVSESNPTLFEAKALAKKIKADLHKYRFLHFESQAPFPWQKHLAFVQLFGHVYDESSHVNRTKFKGETDPRVAIFSNNPDHGLVNVGLEEYHVDGNDAKIPHAATVLYCNSTIEGGDTLLVPLNEVSRLVPDLADVDFGSAHVKGLYQPLIYPHPNTGAQTMMFGLGSLSGLYRRNGVRMTHEETNAVKSAVEASIEKVGPYQHSWNAGDVLMLDNRALALKASPGAQNPTRGLRVLRRVTLASSIRPERRKPLKSFSISMCDAVEGVCLVSLFQYGVDYEPGVFRGVDEAREACKYALHQEADLASLLNRRRAAMATEIVEQTAVPHYIAARKAGGEVQWPLWQGQAQRDSWRGQHPWDFETGQPNDSDGPGSEPCVFVGPHGKWFDFACEPKASTDGATTSGPEITSHWTGGVRHMFNVHPLCQIPFKSKKKPNPPKLEKKKVGLERLHSEL